MAKAKILKKPSFGHPDNPLYIHIPEGEIVEVTEEVKRVAQDFSGCNRVCTEVYVIFGPLRLGPLQNFGEGHRNEYELTE